MSTPANPAPGPVPVSPAPAAERPGRGKALAFFLGLMLFGVATLYYVAGRRPAAPASPSVTVRKTAKVARGTLVVRTRVTGQTSARVFANIVVPKLRSPEGDREIAVTRLAKPGMRVKKGDIIAEFDVQNIRDHLDDTVDGLKQKENDILRKQVQLEVDRKRLEQSLLVAKANLDKAKLDVKVQPIRTPVDQELVKLNLEEAEAAYKAELENLPLQERSQDADLKITKLDQRREVLHVSRHEEDLQRLTMRAPIDGMVVILSKHARHGDQESYGEGDRIAPGTAFMRIIDPGTIQLEGSINQTEVTPFGVGQAATIGLDAYPDARYTGRIYAIGALATTPGRSAFYVRSLPVRVQIDNADPRAIPDLSGYADIVLGKIDDAVITPRASLHEENGQTFVLVQNGASVSRRVVTVGASNGLETAVTSGLNAGDTVLLN